MLNQKRIIRYYLLGHSLRANHKSGTCVGVFKMLHMTVRVNYRFATLISSHERERFGVYVGCKKC